MTLPVQINNLYQLLETINPKELGIRKKLDIFITKDLKDNIIILFHITQKSRFLQKDVDKIDEISNIVINSTQYSITSTAIFIESPLCSKAKAKMEKLQWIVII